jgi:eukaryotic-like serine/threonine-protein kinase
MALSTGTRIGAYEVLAKLGEGGMGEVYRATDTILKRQVAIKVLPDAVAADGERLARFDREAKTLASLNHPNIAAIYGLERSAGANALVMELVEGPTLADVIAQGPIPVAEALPIARQLADALEGAHAQHIIHRDLKPANVKLRPDGTVKVLDFGLAKALEPASAGSSSGPSLSPAITTPAAVTGLGVILGTAAYMSPEQARGRPADRRADIWAFGAVLYEMLSGVRAFAGDEISDTLAFILTKDPDWSALPTDVPAQIRLLLTRCLEKEPRARVSDIAVAKFLMTETIAPPAAVAAGPATGSTEHRAMTSRHPLLMAVVGLAAAAVALAAGVFVGRRQASSSAPAPAVRFEVLPPAGVELQPSPVASAAQLALSPDGRQLAFIAASKANRSQIWIRTLASTQAQPLAGTEGASFPFWSPDNRAIAFFAAGKLKRVDTGGGAPQTLADASAGRGGAWSQDGVILFSGQANSPISRVSASGGAVTPVTTLDAEHAILTQILASVSPRRPALSLLSAQHEARASGRVRDLARLDPGDAGSGKQHSCRLHLGSFAVSARWHPLRTAVR